MKKIIVNGRTLFYNGDPLEVFRGYNKKLNGPIYSGRNNFFVRKKTKTCCEAGSIKDCFDFLKKCTNRNNHLFGFVLDFSTKTVYYDNQNALEYLNVQHLPKRGYDGFFENFIQKEVWSN